MPWMKLSIRGPGDHPAQNARHEAGGGIMEPERPPPDCPTFEAHA